MDAFFRAIVVYGAFLLFFRLSGKRSLAQVTTFDFVMLLIVAETAQQALLGNDFSITNALLLVVTLLGIDIFLAWVAMRSPFIERLVDGVPIIIVKDGKIIKDRTRQARVDEGDILSAARRLQGLERLDQIKYAVLEVDGGVTIIPQPDAQK